MKVTPVRAKRSSQTSSAFCEPESGLLQQSFVQSFFAGILALTFFVAAVWSLLLRSLTSSGQLLTDPVYTFNNGSEHHFESTALLLLGLNQLRAPVEARISGDRSVKGQIHGGPRPLYNFPDRIILMANHQIYTDWIFFWWTAYAAQRHGHFFVILKDSIQKIPVIGRGLKFFSWIFLSRRWETDKANFEDGIRQLADIGTHSPMWLLIFPEGTNMSKRGRLASKKWADKTGITDLKYNLLPRSRGLQCCLQGLADSVDWVYDCTIAYDGIPSGEYGQEVHSLQRLYIEGRAAPMAHMYWRRFAVKDIPYHNSEDLGRWLLQRWLEKDKLYEHFEQNGCFPADGGYITAAIKLRASREAVQILGGVVAVAIAWWVYKALCWTSWAAVHVAVGH